MTSHARKYPRGFPTLVSFILVLTCTSVLEGQDGHREKPHAAPSRSATQVGIGRVPRQLDLTLITGSPFGLIEADVPPLADPSRSKVIAGAASGLIPGLGSFYAGHARHGITHLAVHLVAGTKVTLD